MININKKEVERYLGYSGVSSIDETMSKVIETCIEEMSKNVTPRYTYKTFPIEWKKSDVESDEDKSEGCSFAGIEVSSGNLLKNLKGCSEIVMLAVTIGPSADLLVRRTQIRDMMKAMVYQAVGAAMVEAWCDEVNEKIVEEAASRGLFPRPRFSPGYGDFPLEVQKDFERILEMTKTIGVSLSDSLLMTPTKSVTAVIGLSDIKTDCIKEGCESCNMSETCAYAR